jgi:rhomboid family protein
MGLHDRPYWREEGSGLYGGQAGRGIAAGMPRPGRVVKALLLINIGVFLLQILFDQPRAGYRFGIVSAFFGATPAGFWQLWRYITFQFLHSTDGLWHLGLNMLALYMLGTPLEQRFGPKRFLRFYLGCGAVAGLAYVVIGNVVGGMPDVPIVGASGGVYAIVLACAVFFPHFRLIFFLFPVPIRLAAVIIFGGMILLVLNSFSTGQFSSKFWSDVAHLGGAVASAFYIWVLPTLRIARTRTTQRRSDGAWRRKMQEREEEQAEVDRILDKIRDEGLQSLSAREKRTLREATDRQREDERRVYRS